MPAPRMSLWHGDLGSTVERVESFVVRIPLENSCFRVSMPSVAITRLLKTDVHVNAASVQSKKRTGTLTGIGHLKVTCSHLRGDNCITYEPVPPSLLPSRIVP